MMSSQRAIQTAHPSQEDSFLNLLDCNQSASSPEMKQSKYRGSLCLNQSSVSNFCALPSVYSRKRNNIFLAAC